MKKTLPALFIALLASSSIYAQCIPDSTVTELYSPTASEGLPNGTIGINYDAVIHFNIPAETTIVVTAQIDSIGITDVEGLPVGIGYTCNPPSCIFPGGSFACIQLSGIPTDSADIGDNDLDVKFDLHTNITTISDKITDYSITIEGGATAGVHSFNDSELEFRTTQNPANQFSYLKFEVPASGTATIEIFSLLGAKVSEVSLDANRGDNSIELARFGLESGMYFASLNQGEFSNTVRFILQ
ncbi:MAG TPA: hypothetical protein DCX14_03930 [Flavobacteriales bacterium]|jgi:hypothetical protein|nr:T9SS type A sorting domain-containing protein [Flavobacteriales bacterium]HAW19310.1 hypothetical protein [Flavobacteriales bacterium]